MAGIVIVLLSIVPATIQSEAEVFRQPTSNGTLVVTREEISYVVPEKLRPLFESGRLAAPRHVYRYSLKLLDSPGKATLLRTWEMADSGMMPEGKAHVFLTGHAEPSFVLLLFKEDTRTKAHMLLGDELNRMTPASEPNGTEIFRDVSVKGKGSLKDAAIRGSWKRDTLRIVITNHRDEKYVFEPVKRIDWTLVTAPATTQAGQEKALGEEKEEKGSVHN